MTKSDAIRLTDTIAFIRTAAVPMQHMNKRDIVADMLRDHNAVGLISDTASPAMSQGSNWAIKDRDAVQEVRHYRRAITLIRMALQNSDRSVAPFDTAAVSDTALPAELGKYLGQVVTTKTDLVNKLALLKAQPLQFLSNHGFSMMGAANAGVVRYGFYYDPLSNLYQMVPEASVPNMVYEPEDAFHLHVQAYSSLHTTNRPNPPGGHTLDVVGSSVHGADLMVTTQLTGCSVMYYLNGGNLVAAHVQPTGILAETACTNLRNDGTLTQAPGNAFTAVFGPQNPKGANTNNYQKAGNYNFCVGVRNGGTWDLYAQQRAPGLNGNKVAWLIT